MDSLQNKKSDNKKLYDLEIYSEMDWFYEDLSEPIENNTKLEMKEVNEKEFIDSEVKNLNEKHLPKEQIITQELTQEKIIKEIKEKKEQVISDVINKNLENDQGLKVLFLTGRVKKDFDDNDDYLNHQKTFQEFLKDISSDTSFKALLVNDKYRECNSCFMHEDQEKLLDKMISAMNLNSQDFFKTTLAMPFSEEKGQKVNLSWDNDQSLNYFDYIRLIIKKLKPTFIVTLGAGSTRTLLGNNLKMNASHGKFYLKEFFDQESMQSIIVPIFHPEFLIINPKMKKSTWEDLQGIMKELKL